jgi:HAE1 family hydrophobic/amphiphilic exporter-1
MEQMARSKLPPSMGIDWTGIRTKRRKSAARRSWFRLAVIMVYLVLAAQYESWTNPLAVILVVPLAMLRPSSRSRCAGWRTTSTRRSVLSSHRARQQERDLDRGVRARPSRARPSDCRGSAGGGASSVPSDLMTSLAFVLGVLRRRRARRGRGEPARARHRGVRGMITSTFLALLFVPVFYVGTQGLSERWTARKGRTAVAPARAEPRWRASRSERSARWPASLREQRSDA